MGRFCVLIVSFICFGVSSPAIAARVEGMIVNEKNEPLPFCNVYVRNTNLACASNENGIYSLAIEPGTYTLVYQYIGYTRQEVNITIENKNITLNITLVEEATALSEVVIRSDQEDPAYAVIRNAIEMREENREKIRSYSCDVYIKGLQKFTEAPDKILGIQLNTILDVDTNNTGIIYLSESVSTFHYQYPDKTKEIMNASIVSGNDQSFSWNDAASIEMNFYKNLETLEGFSQRGFVSPIADNALFFYEYKLLSYVFENNHEIFKIQVIPKRKSDPVYTGIIYITDDDYRFTGIQLTLHKENGVDFLDTFRVSQEYYYADEEHLALLSNKFDFSYSVFGIKGQGYFHAFYTDYTINPLFPKKFFSSEIVKIEDNANKQDSIYWSKIRPIQLTQEEAEDYYQKDSLQILKATPEYQDSIDKIFNKFSAGDLISGYNFRNSKKNIFINTNPLPEVVQFNTVEGYLINFRLRFEKEFDSHDELVILPALRYGFGAKSLYANVFVNYMFDQPSRTSVSIRGGNTVNQFNPDGIPPLVNSLYTLLAEENYLKLYASRFLELSFTKELFNGFYLRIGSVYATRSLLENLPMVDSWIDSPNREFTPNYFPFETSTPTETIPTLFAATLNFRYQIKQQYISQPEEKIILNSKYPILEISVKSAIKGVFESVASYNKIEFSMRDNIKLALVGNLEYQYAVGAIISNDDLHTADKLNFAGNETIVMRLQGDSYFLLPYYSALSEKYFAAAHVEWHTEGFLFRKLPLFKQLKLEPVFSVNYLHTDTMEHYFEIAAGIEHIFKIGRIDVAYTPFKFSETYPSEQFRVLFGIGF